MKKKNTHFNIHHGRFVFLLECLDNKRGFTGVRQSPFDVYLSSIIELCVNGHPGPCPDKEVSVLFLVELCLSDKKPQ